MTQIQEQLRWYQSHFAAFERSLNGEAASSLHSIRKAAIARFAELGFPSRKHEEWRFTDITSLTKINFNPVLGYQTDGVSKQDVEQHSFGTKNRLVFINGHFSKEFSTVGALPQGVIVGNLGSVFKTNADLVERHLTHYAKFDDNVFIALNTAFVQDGAFIYVPDDNVVEEAVELLFIATGTEPTFISPRNLILVGKNSQVRIVESYVSISENNQYFTNVVTELFADESSVIEHDKLQNESKSAFHIAAIHAYQKEKSNFTSNSIALGGAVVRNNVTAVLDAEWSECTLNGLSLGTGAQLIDNHTTIDHAKPNCASHELYKAILDGKSKGVFNGKIFVRKDAQKTDAKQTNKTLLLSDEATMDTKPQLEIFADDVKCTHGAAVGQLDAEQIFYLRSRGIDATNARDILTFAFAGDIVERVHVDALKAQLEALVNEKLNQGRKLSA